MALHDCLPLSPPPSFFSLSFVYPHSLKKGERERERKVMDIPRDKIKEKRKKDIEIKWTILSVHPN